MIVYVECIAKSEIAGALSCLILFVLSIDYGHCKNMEEFVEFFFSLFVDAEDLLTFGFLLQNAAGSTKTCQSVLEVTIFC